MLGMRLMLKLAVVSSLAIAAAILLLTGSSPTYEPRPAEAADCNKLAFPDTLQPLINSSRAGDIICVAPGVYRGPVRIDGKTGLTLRGTGQQHTVIAGGNADAMLIFRSRDITVTDLKFYLGNPSNAYVWDSFNVNFERIDAGGGPVGIHYDVSSLGRISDSFIYRMSGDGVLTRNGANVTVERNWIFLNGGVGVSTVGETANTHVVRNIISDNEGPGVFAGQTPCALLPPGFVEIPECYLTNLPSFVGRANVILDTNVIQSSGSTGIVLFPGTRGTLTNNRIWRNELSGLFVWGASFSSNGDEYDLNEEHAIEARAYPDPLKYPQVPSGQRIRAAGIIDDAVIKNSVVLAETGTLGGGVLAQGANLTTQNSRIFGNRGIGVSYVNTSSGRITGNTITNNGGSAICIFKAADVETSANVASGNADNRPGICRETTP